ncbi:beta family protein [Kitasatospora sp. RB6PN24]|uniref:beta family protein n=1 Tax=Kitasatospora humi TaxID=2893891 RepID=UPI001E2AA462|nr:beta family protein [Kitasatospora humi]MCC9310971.1 beta family protein [Kitasatospora humi]
MEYVPILRGKAGEFIALRNTSADVQAHIRPLLEVHPDQRLADIVRTFARHAGEHLPGNLTVTVDCGQLWQHGVVGTGFRGHAMRWLSDAFGDWLHTLIPAFRTTDPAGSLDEIRQTQLAHGAGGCLRIDLHHLPDGPRAMTEDVLDALAAVALEPQDTDLLLDAGYLPDTDTVTALVPRALEVLIWAHTLPWRHIALAGGAFPPTLRRVTPHVLTALRRYDLDLWEHVARRSAGPPPDFGDHGVTHPDPPAAARVRAAPANLRYTSGRHWHVVRAVGTAGVDTLRLCRQLTQADVWRDSHTDLSWGDDEIRIRAVGLADGPGGPSQRRAWETSHHLAAVTRSIAERGRP